MEDREGLHEQTGSGERNFYQRGFRENTREYYRRRNDRRGEIRGGRGRNRGFYGNTVKISERHLKLKIDDRKDHAGIKFSGKLSECDICCRKSDLFGVGACLHPICMECGLRLRVVDDNTACPKCRTVIDTLYFVENPVNWTDFQLPEEFVKNETAEKHGLRLSCDYAAHCFESYLAHVCLICEKKNQKRVFPTFSLLSQHMYMVHKFEFCDICVEHVNMLTRERRFYTHRDLERHMEDGDPDDRSQKGHPQCLFCEKRFLDDEYRYKHLRREHFFCQICDANGGNNCFFPEHDILLEHYKSCHIICDEGECLKLGVVFTTDTELKLHKSSTHAAGPQTLKLDFQFSDRESHSASRGRRNVNRGHSDSSSARGAQRNIPRIGVMPSSQPKKTERPADEEVRIVKSAQAEKKTLKKPANPPFVIRSSDFPRLGKAQETTNAKSNTNTSQKLQPVTTSSENTSLKQTVKEENKPNTWFVDDDEVFPSASANMPQDEVNKEKQTDVETEVESIIPSKDVVWGMKRPHSLGNLAASFHQDNFPSLPSSLKPTAQLPVNSIWSKKKHPFMQEAKISVVSFADSKKPKSIPRPDLWPRGPVPDSWEDDASPNEESGKGVENETSKKSARKEQNEKSKPKTNGMEKDAPMLADAESDAKASATTTQFSKVLLSTVSSSSERNNIGQMKTINKSSESGQIGEPTFSEEFPPPIVLNEQMPSNSLGSNFKQKDHMKTKVTDTVELTSLAEFPSLVASFVKDDQTHVKDSKTEYSRIVRAPPGLSLNNPGLPPGFGPPPGFEGVPVRKCSVEHDSGAPK